jgi:hypothetical protein
LARRITDEILERHWEVVLSLASELERKKQMDSAEIAAVLNKFRPPIQYVDQDELVDKLLHPVTA